MQPNIKFFKENKEVSKNDVVTDSTYIYQYGLYKRVVNALQKEFSKEEIILELWRIPTTIELCYYIKTRTGMPSDELYETSVKSIHASFKEGKVLIYQKKNCYKVA